MIVVKKCIERSYFKQKENLALYDQFTKVYNRNWLDIIAVKKFKRDKIFVTIIDINNLKYINDNYGHIEGDKKILELIYLLEEEFYKEIKNKKIFIVRYGGDEFIIISKIKINDRLLQINNGDFSFGTYEKIKTQNMYDAISIADKNMYLMKNNLYKI